MTGIRSWVVGIAGAAAVAAAGLGASEEQRLTADRNFKEAQAAAQMQVAMPSQERGLDAYLATGKPQTLQLLFQSKLQLTTSLVHAQALSRDDRLERVAVKGQADAFRNWSSLANAAMRRRQGGAPDSASLERARGLIIDDFLGDNGAYRDRLLVNRTREQRDAALLPVWVLLGFGALVGGAAIAAGRRRRKAQDLRQTFGKTQERFVEAIQFAENEAEAHSLLKQHLESTVPGANVLVLNRNNSFDRLEATDDLPEDHHLAEPLLASKPRSCLAVRLSRRYDRGADDAPDVFGCEICGALARPSSCQPLLVGGEVIGSVLIAPDQPLRGEANLRLDESVSAAAPVLANLRNLAIAESRAATDVLTGLPNRSTVDDTLRRMLAHADRNISPLAVAVLDLDHFKQINDTYGHERGDDALAALAALLRIELREGDFAGRSGGEEFVLFFPDTDHRDALAGAEKVRQGVRKLRIEGIDRAITASIGIAVFLSDATTPEALMRCADRALYAARQHGRDRIEIASNSPHAPQLVESLELDPLPL